MAVWDPPKFQIELKAVLTTHPATEIKVESNQGFYTTIDCFEQYQYDDAHDLVNETLHNLKLKKVDAHTLNEAIRPKVAAADTSTYMAHETLVDIISQLHMELQLEPCEEEFQKDWTERFNKKLANQRGKNAEQDKMKTNPGSVKLMAELIKRFGGINNMFRKTDAEVILKRAARGNEFITVDQFCTAMSQAVDWKMNPPIQKAFRRSKSYMKMFPGHH